MSDGGSMGGTESATTKRVFPPEQSWTVPISVMVSEEAQRKLPSCTVVSVT